MKKIEVLRKLYHVLGIAKDIVFMEINTQEKIDEIQEGKEKTNVYAGVYDLNMNEIDRIASDIISLVKM